MLGFGWPQLGFAEQHPGHLGGYHHVGEFGRAMWTVGGRTGGTVGTNLAGEGGEKVDVRTPANSRSSR